MDRDAGAETQTSDMLMWLWAFVAGFAFGAAIGLLVGIAIGTGVL